MASSDTLSAKRLGPGEVAPVIIGSLRFEAIHWGRDRGLAQNGGYVAASDSVTGEELWTLKVYHIDYDPDLESDVQDVFIRSMAKTWFGNKLKVTDERGGKYVVDPVARTVSPG
ncbi:MAG: hypothetical protein FIA97_00595 [Methylococcaceae bacterium]|nr:hypothetical protein [Methylococcaceae bacterium]